MRYNKYMSKTSKKKPNKSAAELGRLGGLAVVKKHGIEHMEKIGKKGSDARWGSKNKK